MALMYRGMSLTRARDFVAGRAQMAATGNGEFGNGIYFWRDDVAAGVISALQYHGQVEGGWAVMSVDVAGQAIMQQGITAPMMLNFRPAPNRASDYTRGYDPNTDTTMRSVTIPAFGADSYVRLNFREFREINANPEEFGLNGVSNELPWDQYPIIAGPTVACPNDATLTQVKFRGNGLAVLNAAPKALVHWGPPVNNTTFGRIRNWDLATRARTYDTYFRGTTSPLALVIG